jgi:hypothetical protein
MRSRDAIAGAVLAGLIVGGGTGAAEGDVWVGVTVGVLMTAAVGILNARDVRARLQRNRQR